MVGSRSHVGGRAQTVYWPTRYGECLAPLLIFAGKHSDDVLIGQHAFHLLYREGDLEVLFETQAEIDVSERVPRFDAVHSRVTVNRIRVQVEYVAHDLPDSLFHCVAARVTGFPKRSSATPDRLPRLSKVQAPNRRHCLYGLASLRSHAARKGPGPADFLPWAQFGLGRVALRTERRARICRRAWLSRRCAQSRGSSEGGCRLLPPSPQFV